MLNFLHQLQSLDIDLLHLLNVTLANPNLDQFWLVMSHLERQWWAVYVILPAVLLRLGHIYRWDLWKLFVALGLVVGATDLFCFRVIKHFVLRARPFENPDILAWVRHVGDAHGPSFPSNHAANCFAAAVILSFFMGGQAYLFYTFAILVGLSRIALGVHYPSDVLGGALIGYGFAALARKLIMFAERRIGARGHVSKSNAELSSWRTRLRRLEED